MKSFAVVFLFLAAISATAALGESIENGIGIYADLAGQARHMTAEPGLVELYVLGINVQAEDGISVWEMGLESQGPISFVGYRIPYSGIDVSRFPNLVMTSFEPLPKAPVIHLLTLTYEVIDVGPAELYIKEFTGGYPVEGGSLNNYLPVFGSGDVRSEGFLRNLHPVSGSIDAPVFVLNGAVPLSVEAESWGNLKALFR